MSVPVNSDINPLPDNNNISIDIECANRAAIIGDLDTLMFLSSLNPAIYPDQEGANRAAENGQLSVLRWLENLESPIRANRKDLDFKNLDALKWYDVVNFLEVQEVNTAS